MELGYLPAICENSSNRWAGEPFESLPKVGFMIDISFWTLAITSQAITRIYTKLKHPLLINESPNELFSNHSLIICFVARFIPPIVTGLGFHVNVVQSCFICGKVLFIPFQIIYCHSKAKEFLFNNHPKLLAHYYTLKKKTCLRLKTAQPNNHCCTNLKDNWNKIMFWLMFSPNIT